MKVRKIKIPLYFGELVVIECKNFSKINERYKTEMTNEWQAGVIRHTTKKGYTQYIVAFLEKPSPQTIAHEAVHIVNHIFADRYVNLDLYNDEPQAYLTGWVVEQIHKTIKQ